jgi:SCP-2 sterol transfer family
VILTGKGVRLARRCWRAWGLYFEEEPVNDDSKRPQSTGRVREGSFLSYFTSPFPRLTEANERDLGDTFERLAALIGESRLRARVHFGIVDGDDLFADAVRSWSLDLGTDGCLVRAERAPDPDLEVLASEETWWLIAEGALSPLEAFRKGAIRVRGDLKVAARFARQVSPR